MDDPLALLTINVKQITHTGDNSKVHYEYLDGNRVRITDANGYPSIYTYELTGSE